MPISRKRSSAIPPPRPPVNPGGPVGGGRARGRSALSPRRLAKRLVLAVIAGLAILALDRFGLLDKALGPMAGQRFDGTNDYQLVEHLRTLVVRRGMTKDSKDCLLFIINGNDPPQASRLDVMEKHSGSCPGTRGELPKLFTLRVDRPAHTIQTDAGSPGSFHDLP